MIARLWPYLPIAVAAVALAWPLGLRRLIDAVTDDRDLADRYDDE